MTAETLAILAILLALPGAVSSIRYFVEVWRFRR